MNPVRYAGQDAQRLAAGLAPTRGPSPALWHKCPFNEILIDPNRGWATFDDFDAWASGPTNTTAYGRYATFCSDGGYIRQVLATTNVHDRTVLSLSSDGDNEGASVISGGCPVIVDQTYPKEFWFEARVKVSTITDTKFGLLVGLIHPHTVPTAILPITAAGAIGDVDMIGFHRLEADGDKFDTVYKASGQTQQTVKADAIDLSTCDFATNYEGQWIKLGMHFDGTIITFYADGAPLADTVTATAIAAATFPEEVFLSPFIALLNATGTTPGAAYIDWWRVAQLA